MDDQELIPLPSDERELEIKSVINHLHILWRRHHDKSFQEILEMALDVNQPGIVTCLTVSPSDGAVGKRFRKLSEGARFDIPLHKRI